MKNNEIIATIRKALKDGDVMHADNFEYVFYEYEQASHKDLSIRYTAAFVVQFVITAFRLGRLTAHDESGNIHTRQQLIQERVDLTARLDKMPKIRCHPNAFARAYLLGAKFALEWVGGKPRKASEFKPDWPNQKGSRETELPTFDKPGHTPGQE
jgi:hypothetical protein